jgi:alpha-1,4-digalacturonate transport system permease protein
LNSRVSWIDRPFAWMQGRIGQRNVPWLFLLPNLLVLGTFALLPVFINVVYALTRSDRLYLTERPYAGAENITLLFDCSSYVDPSSCSQDLFWRAVHNTAWFVVVQVAAMIFFSLLTALVLNREIRWRGFFRAVFFFPVLLSPVVIALVWKWLLQRQGLLNAGLELVGAEDENWLVERRWAFFWSVFVSVWAHMGFYTLILLAGLQSIPRNVYEAAALDAAPRWRVLTRITLPMLAPTLLVVGVLALIRAVQVFDEVYVLTGGGPGSATTFLVQYIYETGFAAEPRDFGLAATASLALGAVLLILTLVRLRISRRQLDG